MVELYRHAIRNTGFRPIDGNPVNGCVADLQQATLDRHTMLARFLASLVDEKIREDVPEFEGDEHLLVLLHTDLQRLNPLQSLIATNDDVEPGVFRFTDFAVKPVDAARPEGLPLLRLDLANPVQITQPGNMKVEVRFLSGGFHDDLQKKRGDHLHQWGE